MIDKKHEARERRRGLFLPKGDRVVYRNHKFLYPLYAALSFFLPFFFRREVEPFELLKVKPEERGTTGAGRFDGFTFKRVKKVGNFFAYGWVKHDKRLARAVV